MSTIYCIGRNYVKHAQELGNEVPTTPVVFLKAESSLYAEDIAFSHETFHHEVEIVLKMARDFRLHERSSPKDIEAMALGLDLTRREVQNELKAKGLPWTLAKSFAGSAVIGKWRPFTLGPHSFELHVNGQLRQKGDTRHMIFSFLAICDYLNTFAPLKKGDLIFTGTPEGVAGIKKGDSFQMIFNGETETLRL